MENTIQMKFWLKKVSMLLAGILFFLFMFNDCANRKPALSVALYSFEYNGENYRIRSISSKKDELSFNEIISNKFVAKDYDQDGFIDEITLGEINLSGAQKIYEYSLTMLSKQNKLRAVSPNIDVYQYENSDYNYEIRSFRPANAEPFNQFRIIKNNRILNPQIIIGIDQKADGTLDVIIKGTISLEAMQNLYSEMLRRGLEKKELIEINHRIIVK